MSLFTVDTEKQSSSGPLTFDKHVSGERMETMQDEMDFDRNLARKNVILINCQLWFVNQRSMETYSFTLNYFNLSLRSCNGNYIISKITIFILPITRYGLDKTVTSKY